MREGISDLGTMFQDPEVRDAVGILRIQNNSYNQRRESETGGKLKEDVKEINESL